MTPQGELPVREEIVQTTPFGSLIRFRKDPQPSQPRVLPRGHISVDPILECGQAGLLQTRDLRLGERLIGDIGERRAPPHAGSRRRKG